MQRRLCFVVIWLPLSLQFKDAPVVVYDYDYDDYDYDYYYHYYSYSYSYPAPAPTPTAMTYGAVYLVLLLGPTMPEWLCQMSSSTRSFANSCSSS